MKLPSLRPMTQGGGRDWSKERGGRDKEERREERGGRREREGGEEREEGGGAHSNTTNVSIRMYLH